jgi:hypothetical protein
MIEIELLSRIFEEFQHPAIQTKIVQQLGSVRRLEAFLYFAAQKFELFRKKIKIKKLKPIVVDVLSEAYPLSNDTTLMLI